MASRGTPFRFPRNWQRDGGEQFQRRHVVTPEFFNLDLRHTGNQLQMAACTPFHVAPWLPLVDVAVLDRCWVTRVKRFSL